MAALWLPRDDRHTLALREPNLLVPKKKPVGQIELDYANNITNGLILYVDYGSNGYQSQTVDAYPPPARFLVNKIGAIFSSAFFNRQIIYTEEGCAYRAASASNSGGITLPAGWNSSVFSAQEATFHIRLRRNSSRSNYLSDFDATSQSSYPFSGVFYNGIFRSSRITLTGVYSASMDDNFHNLTVTSSAIGDFHKTYIKGDIKDSRTQSWGIPANTVDNRLLFPGEANKDVLQFCMWNRALSDTEIKSLELNPYQMLRPANSTPYLISVPTSGATVTLSSPTATATGSTTATVGCTVTYT